MKWKTPIPAHHVSNFNVGSYYYLKPKSQCKKWPNWKGGPFSAIFAMLGYFMYYYCFCEQKGILICNNQAYTGGPLILCLQTGKVHYSEINTYYLVFASHSMWFLSIGFQLAHNIRDSNIEVWKCMQKFPCYLRTSCSWLLKLLIHKI